MKRLSQLTFFTFVFHCVYSAVNSENGEMNKVRNQINGEFGAVPDVARFYKVKLKITKLET
jgi:hypothetical protein